MTKVRQITEPPREWAKVQKAWDKAPKTERDAFYERNAVAIDRWQSEADAMAETTEGNEEGAK